MSMRISMQAAAHNKTGNGAKLECQSPTTATCVLCPRLGGSRTPSICISRQQTSSRTLARACSASVNTKNTGRSLPHFELYNDVEGSDNLGCLQKREKSFTTFAITTKRERAATTTRDVATVRSGILQCNCRHTKRVARVQCGDTNAKTATSTSKVCTWN